MSLNNGNATNIQTYADFLGRVLKNLWPAVKGMMTSEQMAAMTDSQIIDAIRNGFCPLVSPRQLALSQMKGIYLYENAKALFNDSPSGTACKTKSKNLTERLNDHKIIEEYGEEIIFESVSDLHATISNFVAKQPEGQKGELLNNGHANIFYVRVNGQVHYVLVDWDDDKWHVSSFPFDSDQWNVGSRVFCNC